MAIPNSFMELAAHPSPGLHFPPDSLMNCGEYILPAPHSFGPPAAPELLGLLRERTAACPAAQQELLDFYSRWNGAGLCCIPEPDNGNPEAALVILPIEWWDKTAAELTGERAWMFRGLEEMYVPGRFITIAASPSEDARLVLFLQGQFEGQQLTGKIFCTATDPVLGFTETVANSFFDLLDQFASDPAAFLEKIGYTSVVKDSANYISAVADRYLPDCGTTRAADGSRK